MAYGWRAAASIEADRRKAARGIRPALNVAYATWRVSAPLIASAKPFIKNHSLQGENNGFIYPASCRTQKPRAMRSL